MLFSMYNWISLFSVVGLLIQNGQFVDAFQQSGTTTMTMILIMVFLVFYPTAVYFCFKAYREFKGMLHDNGMLGQGGGVGNAMFRGGTANNNNGGYQNLNNQEMGGFNRNGGRDEEADARPQAANVNPGAGFRAF